MVEAPARLTADVVVIGAGFAGLSAATRLAEAGRRVVVVEAAARAGGRASTFVDTATSEPIDNGQHVLFGCYTQTYEFLRRIGTAHLAPLDGALSVALADDTGRRSTLACPRMPAPWHLFAGILRWDAVNVRNRLTALRMAGALRSSGELARLEQSGMSVTQWLQARGQGDALRRWLWNPLAFAALNQSPDVARAAPFARVLAEMFAPRAGAAALGVARVPLDELYVHPAARFIEEHGGLGLTGMPARIATNGSGAFLVRAGTREIAAPAVISAVPWHAFEALWSGDCPEPVRSIAAAASGMSSSPIVTTNLWFDRRVMDDRLLGIVDGPIHWAFDRGAFVGGRARHVALVSSGAEPLAAAPNEVIVATALDHLGRAIPAVRHAQVLRARVVKERRATFSLAGGEPPRPATRTPLTGFFVAGDWTDTGLPATIESAVISGHRAAREILA